MITKKGKKYLKLVLNSINRENLELLSQKIKDYTKSTGLRPTGYFSSEALAEFATKVDLQNKLENSDIGDKLNILGTEFTVEKQEMPSIMSSSGRAVGVELGYVDAKGNKQNVILPSDDGNLATQNELHPFFCIADLANLPFMDNSIDAIIDIFSPSSYGEFLRVLKNEGKLYKVIPNANYLIELRHLLYGDTGSRKSSYSNDKVLNLFSKHFPNFESKRIRYKFNLTPENFKNLLLMTPLSWGASNEQLEYARQNPLNEITVDVTLLIA